MMADNAPWTDDDYIKHKEELRKAEQKKQKKAYDKYYKSFIIPYDQLDKDEKKEIDKKVNEWKEKLPNNKVLTKKRLQTMEEGIKEEFIYELKKKYIPTFEEWRNIKS